MEKVKAVFTWVANEKELAYSIGEKYKSMGFDIIYYGECEEDDINNIAINNKANHLMHFISYEKILLVNINEGYTVEVQVKDLMFS